MGKAGKQSEILAVQIINAVSGTIAAIVSGGSPGGILSGIGGLVGLFNPIAGAAIGGLGAIISANESRHTTVDRYGSEALAQLRGLPSGPLRFELTVVSATTGEVVERTVYELGQQQNSDGVTRLVVGGR